MKVFKIMGLYLIAALVFTACSKDQDNTQLENDANFTVKSDKAPDNTESDYAFDYYGASQTISNDIEENGLPSLPISNSDIAYYSELVGFSGEVDSEVLNELVEQSMLAQEMGPTKYVNEKLDASRFTKNTILDIMENGPVKDLTRIPEFYEIPDVEQNMLMATNAAAKNYSDYWNSRTQFEMVVDVIYGTLIGAATGAYYGMMCCGPVGGVVFGVIGGFIGGIFGWLGSGSK